MTVVSYDDSIAEKCLSPSDVTVVNSVELKHY